MQVARYAFGGKLDVADVVVAVGQPVQPHGVGMADGFKLFKIIKI